MCDCLIFICLGSDGPKKEDNGVACRINGKIPVLKGSGDRLTISVGKSLNIGNLFAHFGNSQTKCKVL